MLLDFAVHPEDVNNPEFQMIGLHGRDANKYAFFPFVRQMGFLHTQWILPSATFHSKSSKDVRFWFDRETQNSKEITQSRKQIGDLLDMSIMQGIRPENIFLIGFSQGAVMAVDTGLRYQQRLGGIVALSGYVAHPDLLQRETSDANRQIPIFWGHGTRDQIISVERGRENAEVLKDMGYHVEYHEYDTSHRISSPEVKDIRAFLHRHMYGMSIEEAEKHAGPKVIF